MCGCCSRENNSLVVHTYPGGVHRREQFRNRDAEVIGKIVVGCSKALITRPFKAHWDLFRLRRVGSGCSGVMTFARSRR